MKLAPKLDLVACMEDVNCLIMLLQLCETLLPVNQPAQGGVWVVWGKGVCLNPLAKIHAPPKAMFCPTMSKRILQATLPLLHLTAKQQWIMKKIHHSPRSKYSILTQFLLPNPSSLKYPPQLVLPSIYWIVSGMIIRLKNIKVKLVRSEWDVSGVTFLSVVGMLLEW